MIHGEGAPSPQEWVLGGDAQPHPCLAGPSTGLPTGKCTGSCRSPWPRAVPAGAGLMDTHSAAIEVRCCCDTPVPVLILTPGPTSQAAHGPGCGSPSVTSTAPQAEPPCREAFTFLASQLDAVQFLINSQPSPAASQAFFLWDHLLPFELPEDK